MMTETTKSDLEDIIRIATPIQKDPEGSLSMTVVEYGPDGAEKPVKDRTMRTTYEFDSSDAAKIVKAARSRLKDIGLAEKELETKRPDELAETILRAEQILEANHTRREKAEAAKRERTQAARMLVKRVLAEMVPGETVQMEMTLAAKILGTKNTEERTRLETELAERVFAERAPVARKGR